MTTPATPWKPLSGHVSQLQPNPNTGGLDGRDDCGPACLVRVLRELGKLSVAVDVPTQLNQMRELITGLPDVPGQAGTSTSDLEKALAHYGVDAFWTTDYNTALGAAFSILLIGSAPIPTQYPQSWLGGQDHWIVWLPRWEGAANWFNDPLAYTNGQVDNKYLLSSVQLFMIGAIIVPYTAPKAAHQKYGQVKERCALKTQADHVCTAVAQIPGPPEGRILITDRESGDWTWVEWAGRWGWLPNEKFVAVPS